VGQGMKAKSLLLDEIFDDKRKKEGYLPSLIHLPREWKNQPSIAIRIPKIFAERLKDLARKWDVQEDTEDLTDSELVEKIKIIVAKIENQERGYKANGASQLIKDLKSLKDS
jgi:hypothetical protein